MFRDDAVVSLGLADLEGPCGMHKGLVGHPGDRWEQETGQHWREIGERLVNRWLGKSREWRSPRMMWLEHEQRVWTGSRALQAMTLIENLLYARLWGYSCD